MVNQNDQGGTSGGGPQDRQSGGNRDQQQSGQAGHGGQQMGGGADQADFDTSGGSSGSGGYGNAQDQQGKQSQAAYGNSNDLQQSRGESFDEVQGGGRGADSVSDDAGADQEESANPELDAAADAMLGQQAGQHGDQSRSENEDIEQA